MSELGSNERLVVGVMTGTSLDGIDLALARVRGRGLGVRAELVRHRHASLGLLATPLRLAAERHPRSAEEFARLGLDLGRFHAEAIADLLEGDERADLIVLHGQTVVHRPPASWQLINPWPVAARFGCAVVSDLRGADLAAGGEGAPITPLADWVLFRDDATPRAIVNLGGFCNVTLLPASAGAEPERALGEIRAFDVCACNQVLDAVVRQTTRFDYDDGGRFAAEGTVVPGLTASLRDVLEGQRAGGRSLGTGDEAIEWARARRAEAKPADLLASAVEAVAATIGGAIRGETGEQVRGEGEAMFLAGGGAKNATLAGAIARHAGIKARTTAELGVPVEAREALAMAVLGALAWDGVAITLPGVTGRSEAAPLGGLWTGGPPPRHGEG